jgi:hypothetical protein
MFRLAMSLAFSVLAAVPAYSLPAARADVLPDAAGQAPPGDASGAPPASRKVRIGGGSEPERAQSGELLETVATGFGKDPEEARRRALRSAVEQVVGTLVLAKDLLENDELIDSKVISVANGFVERYEPIGDPKSEDGSVQVRVRAWVKVEKVVEVLTANSIAVRRVDGRSLAAKVTTRKMRDDEAVAAIREIFVGWPNSVLDIGIEFPDGEGPRIVSSDPAGGTVIEVWVQAKINPAKWEAWAKGAQDVLRACALSETEGWWNFQSDWKRLSTSLLANVRGGSDGADPDWNARVAREFPLLCQVIPSSVWEEAFDGPENPYAAGGLADRHPEFKSESGGVMVFSETGSPARWYRLDPRLVQAVRSGVRPFPRVDVRPVDARGKRLGEPLRDWKDVPSLRSGGRLGLSGSRAGRDLLAFGSITPGSRASSLNSWSGAIPCLETGSTLCLMPCMPASVKESSLQLSPALNFPYRFRLSARELESLEQISVEVRPPATIPDDW